MNFGYNKSLYGHSRQGLKNNDNQKQAVKEANKNRIYTPELRAKLKLNNLGRRPIRTQIIVENILTRELIEFKSVAEASRQLKIKHTTIFEAIKHSRLCNNKYKIKRK